MTISTTWSCGILAVRRAAAVGLCLALVAAGTPPAVAQPPGASAWSQTLHAALRLVDGGPDIADPALWRAGIEFRLDPNFKTYWRSPGDSGLPPVFSWGLSENVAEVTVAWPAPYRFEDQAGSSIGYVEHVLLPLRVRLADPRKPALLVLKVDYAICEKICIPAKGEAQIKLSPKGQSTAHARALDEAEARLPKPGRLGGSGAPAVLAAAATPDGRALTVTAKVPDTRGIVDIFTEGPDGWVFSAPMAVATLQQPDGTRQLTYRVTVDGRPKDGRLADMPVRFTMTAGDEAIEIDARLDLAGAAH
jgi:suppressor for copper-sensitivity B